MVQLVRHLHHCVADNLVPQHVSLLEYGADDVDFEVFILDVGNRVVNLGVEFVAHIAHGGDAQFFQGIEELGLYHFHALHQVFHGTILLGQCSLQIIRYRKHSLDGCGSAVAVDCGFFALGALAEVVIFRPGAQVLVFQSSQFFLRLFQLGLNFLQLFAGDLAALFLFLLGLSGLRFGCFSGFSMKS